jgi:uncharacterized protein (DUF1501 family)
MNKRNFLKLLLTTTTLYKTNLSFAQENKTKLLFVYLRGAADGLNMIIPNDSYYCQYRPTLSISQAQSLKISNDFSIHPNLEKSFYSLYKKNNAIFIPMAGQDDNSRSHFQSQDVMAFGANNNGSSGFLNRLATILQSQAVSFSELLPNVFKGNYSVPTLSLKNSSNEDYTKYVSEIRANSPLENTHLSEYNKIVQDINMRNNTKDNLLPTRFKKIAQFMDTSQVNLGYIELDSWDTHSQQGTIHGEFGRLTNNLDQCICAFKDNTTYWSNTVVVIMSEFGRTVFENGSKGTDHGHGNLMTLLGGAIHSSKILGEWNTLELKNLHENRDLPVYHNYKNILSKVFYELYGLNSKQLDTHFTII